MPKAKRNFLYIPTWIFVTLTILFIGTSIYNLYLALYAESLSTVSMNGVILNPGSPEYNLGMELIKKSFLKTSGVTLAISFVAGYFSYKRIKK